MRFTKDDRPKHGDRRVRRFFAWLPVRIHNEVRWLEYVEFEESYYKGEWTRDRFMDL